MRNVLKIVILACLGAAVACTPTTGGGGGGWPTWCVGDSLTAGGAPATSYTHWAECRNVGESGAGYVTPGIYGLDFEDWLLDQIQTTGVTPERVVVMGGVNDLIAASPNPAAGVPGAASAAQHLSETLQTLGIDQVWSTAPLVAGPITGVNAALQSLNAQILSLPNAVDCGPVVTSWVDGTHPTAAASQAFGECIQAALVP